MNLTKILFISFIFLGSLSFILVNMLSGVADVSNIDNYSYECYHNTNVSWWQDILGYVIDIDVPTSSNEFQCSQTNFLTGTAELVEDDPITSKVFEWLTLIFGSFVIFLAVVIVLKIVGLGSA